MKKPKQMRLKLTGEPKPIFRTDHQMENFLNILFDEYLFKNTVDKIFKEALEAME